MCMRQAEEVKPMRVVQVAHLYPAVNIRKMV